MGIEPIGREQRRKRSIHFDEMVRSLESGNQEGRLRGCEHVPEVEGLGDGGNGGVGNAMGKDGCADGDNGIKGPEKTGYGEELGRVKEEGERRQRLARAVSWSSCTTAVSNPRNSVYHTGASIIFPSKTIRDCKLRLAEVCLEIARLSRERDDLQPPEASPNTNTNINHSLQLE